MNDEQADEEAHGLSLSDLIVAALADNNGCPDHSVINRPQMQYEQRECRKTVKKSGRTLTDRTP